LTSEYVEYIFNAHGGQKMKNEKLILVITIVILIGSGIGVYIIKSSPESTNPPQQAQMNVQAPMQNIELSNQAKQLESMLESDPENLNLLINLGNVYYDMSNSEKSIIYYERALKIQPDNPMVMVDCGAMYREFGNPDKAIEMFRGAMKVNPELPQAYFNLGAVLRMEKNSPKEAAAIWKKYLELVPNPGPEVKRLLEEEIAKAENM